MDPIAILSDVHANLEACEAVLAAIDSMGIEHVYSLGDVVGYGPDPVPCLLRVLERCRVGVMGNHEHAIVDPYASFVFNPIAKQAIDWTKEQVLEAGVLDALAALPSSHQEGELLFVHGSVREPIDEYVREADERGYSNFDDVVDTLENDFSGFNVCFVGHNHKPFLATAEGFLHPHSQLSEFLVAGEKLYVSVGSVGQPRDGDPRACFCTFDGRRVRYHRVEYPHEITSAKIIKKGLHQRLAERLSRGR